VIKLEINENLKKIEEAESNCVLCDRFALLADGYCVTCWDDLTFPGEGYTREPRSSKKYRKSKKGYEKVY
jgi:hypothetical protein